MTVATILASTLQLDVASVSASLALDKFWVPIDSGVDVKTKQQLGQMNLPGIGFADQYQRFYPEASMAAQLLGFVGKTAVVMTKDILVWKDFMTDF